MPMRYINIEAERDASHNPVIFTDPIAPYRNYHLVDLRNAVGAGVAAGGSDVALEVLTQHEFGTLFRGKIVFEGSDGRRMEFEAGDSFVLPAGLSGRLTASQDMSRSFLICGRDIEGPPAEGPIRVDLHAERTPCPGPSEELLLTPAPATVAAESYRSLQGIFQVGVWQCGAFDRRPALARGYELMQIVEGSAELQNEADLAEPFLKGQSVLIHPGISYVLRSPATFAKVYATVKLEIGN